MTKKRFICCCSFCHWKDERDDYPSSLICPYDSAKIIVQDNLITCSNCGWSTLEEVEYCEKCGELIRPQSNE